MSSNSLSFNIVNVEDTYVGNLPAGFSDDEDDDDSDFSFMEPRQPIKHVSGPVVTTQEKFQAIVVGGKFIEFQTMIKEEFNGNVDYRFNNGWTPLMYACFHGQHQMMDYLLENGADPNAHSDSVTPMLLVFGDIFGSDERLCGTAARLLDHGAILNLGDKQGITPLMRAIQDGRCSLAEFMIEKNANIEMRDREGWTAIFWAVHCNRMPVLELLISKDARLTEVDRSNRTILDIAESNKHTQMVQLLEKYFTKRLSQETTKYLNPDPYYWLEYYPGLRKNDKPLFKEEIVNLLYGMNCDHLRNVIFKNNIDLMTFLLMEEKDMIAIGINMEFERQRLKQGLRAFHTRNWKLKAVSGLYAKLAEKYELIDCLEHIGNHLFQIYIIEASLKYAIRQFKKLQGQLKFEPPDLQAGMKETVNCLSANINKFKKEIVTMHKTVEKIRRNSPGLLQYNKELEKQKEEYRKSLLRTTSVGVITFGLGFLACLSVTRCFSSLLNTIALPTTSTPDDGAWM